MAREEEIMEYMRQQSEINFLDDANQRPTLGGQQAMNRPQANAQVPAQNMNNNTEVVYAQFEDGTVIPTLQYTEESGIRNKSNWSNEEGFIGYSTIDPRIQDSNYTEPYPEDIMNDPGIMRIPDRYRGAIEDPNAMPPIRDNIISTPPPEMMMDSSLYNIPDRYKGDPQAMQGNKNQAAGGKGGR